MQTGTLESGHEVKMRVLIPKCAKLAATAVPSPSRINETRVEGRNVSQPYVRSRKCHVVKKPHYFSSGNKRERLQKPEMAVVLQIYDESLGAHSRRSTIGRKSRNLVCSANFCFDRSREKSRDLHWQTQPTVAIGRNTARIDASKAPKVRR